MNLFALVVTEGGGMRAFLFLDPDAATAYGERLRADKPAEATDFHFRVLPLEQA